VPHWQSFSGGCDAGVRPRAVTGTGNHAIRRLNIHNLEESAMKHATPITVLVGLALAGAAIFASPFAFAHCQIPCGIYDDHARIQTMREDVATVEKSVKLIRELSGKTDAQSQNQLVRWVMNKEKHAQNIIATVSDYFLTQRVKPDAKDYAQRLARHHAVILAAMKAKQNADMPSVEALRQSVEAVSPYYPASP
jgi:nickel superoxide dismutase